MQFDDLRRDYSEQNLKRNQLAISPFDQFRIWFEECLTVGIIEPNAMALATASSNGIPSCRMVLMKHFDEDGLIFYTNNKSRKGLEIEAQSNVSCCFYWKEVERQILIEGKAIKTTEEESNDYFNSRPRGSRLGTLASKQDARLASKQCLLDEYTRLEALYNDKEIPCPPFWGGYRIIPHRFEFWQGSSNRLHDRFCYTKASDASWTIERLSP